jgi:hypothetical protein
MASLGCALAISMAPPALASAPSYTQNDKLYVSYLREETGYFAGVPAKSLIKYAKVTCKVLRTSNLDAFDVVLDWEERGWTRDKALTLVVSAVTFYCPDQDPSS